MALPEIPYDEWFDPNYKYTHPYDNWPMATDNEKKKDKDTEAEISLHEKMYRLATEKHNPWGSEGFHTRGSQMSEEKQLITEVETDSYLRKKGKRKNVKEEEIFDKEDYCEGEFIPGFHD